MTVDALTSRVALAFEFKVVGAAFGANEILRLACLRGITRIGEFD